LENLFAARRLLAEGQKLLTNVELERAEGAFFGAEQKVREALVLPEATALYAEVLRWRGVALLELHRPQDAAKSFRRALALRPEAQLTETDVRPDVVAMFRRSAAQIGPPLLLRLTPQAGGRPLPPSLISGVSVDGLEVALKGGHADVLLPPGEHIVTIRAPGYLLEGQLITLPQRMGPLPAAPEPFEVAVPLRTDYAELALSKLRREPVVAGLGALCSDLGLDDVIAVTLGRDGNEAVLIGQRYHCPAGTFTAPEVARLGRGESPTVADPMLGQMMGRFIAQLWHAGFQAPPKKTPTAVAAVTNDVPDLWTHPALRQPRPPKNQTMRRTSFIQKPWLWLGLAAVSAGVILGVSFWPRDGQTTITIDPRAFGLTLRAFQ
jgi:hypothetical protein